jgi:hypothetical protein
MKFPISLFFIVLLAGCAGTSVKETLGLKKEPPDEFVVLSRPSLTVPPDFQLVPPGEERAEFDSESLRQSARKEILEDMDVAGSKQRKAVPVGDVDSLTSGEAALLSKAKAENADDSIRKKLKKERDIVLEEREAEQDSFVSSITEPLRPKRGDPVLDASAEAKRIRAAKKENKTLTGENVPVIDLKDEPLLDIQIGQ